MFDEQGSPSPYLDRVAAMLGNLDEGYRESGAFFAALERHELLEPMSLDVELKDGSKHRLVGYHVIAEERLRALDGAALGSLHRRRSPDAGVHGAGLAFQPRRAGRAQEPGDGRWLTR